MKPSHRVNKWREITRDGTQEVKPTWWHQLQLDMLYEPLPVYSAPADLTPADFLNFLPPLDFFPTAADLDAAGIFEDPEHPDNPDDSLGQGWLPPAKKNGPKPR